MALPKERERLFTQSIVQLDSIPKNRKTSFTVRSGATILRGLMPAMSERENGLTRATKQQANNAFGTVLAERFGNHLGTTTGAGAELLALYLLSRDGIDDADFLYAGSPREEKGVGTRKNHDSYKMWHTGDRPTKYPLQLKKYKAQSLLYDVPSISLETTLRPVFTSIGSDSLSDVMAMAALEHMGQSSAYQEVALDFAGHCLRSAVENLMYANILEDLRT